MGKAGFITACYIIIVPILGLFFKKKCSPVIVGAVALSVVGLYLLCMTGGDLAVNKGDLLMLVDVYKRQEYLFARGAAYKGADYTHDATSYPYIFVCEGRLRAEVALRVMRRGRESSLVVASYGDNWYESKSSLDLIVDGQNEIEFTITPLDSKKRKLVRVPLSGFPERPPRTTRAVSYTHLDVYKRQPFQIMFFMSFKELFN